MGLDHDLAHLGFVCRWHHLFSTAAVIWCLKPYPSTHGESVVNVDATFPIAIINNIPYGGEDPAGFCDKNIPRAFVN